MTSQTLYALLQTVVIENKRGEYKDFHASADYPLKGVTYPTDYGYLPGYTGEDGADLDLFVGSADNGLAGYIRVARPDTQNGETKFFVNTTTSEIEAIQKAFASVLLESHVYDQSIELLDGIKPFTGARL